MSQDSPLEFAQLPNELQHKIDELCDQAESAWLAGDSPSITDYLFEPGNIARAALLQHLVKLELDYRQQRAAASNSAPVSIAVVVDRYPELEDEIRSAIRRALQGSMNSTARQSHTNTRTIEVVCPDCREPFSLASNAPLTNVRCPNCTSHFDLVSEGTATRDAQSISRIEHFELIERLGEGAYGVVWKARDTKLDRIVAIKIPRKGELTPTEQERFVREGRAAAQLKHPNIVAIYEIGTQPHATYLVTELIRGLTLAESIRERRPTQEQATDITAKVASALHHAHENGVIHRDLKPHNIMMDHDGEPHVMDFGLAKRQATDANLSVPGEIFGTPAYMSPEQAMGEGHEADRRSDIYSLGVILYQLLTGKLPYQGAAKQIMHQTIVEPVPDPRDMEPGVPVAVAEICQRCLAKNPDDRYQTADELADALQQTSLAKPRKQSNASYWIAASLLLAALSGVTWWAVGRTAVNSAGTDSKAPPQDNAQPDDWASNDPIDDLFAKRINVGGKEYRDQTGRTWLADDPFRVDGTVVTGKYEDRDFEDTTDDDLFRSYCYGNVRFTIPLPRRRGAYDVVLYFAEHNIPVTKGQRVFDIQVEDETVAHSFDVVAEVGSANRAGLFTIRRFVVEDGELNIAMVPQTAKPILSAIEVTECPTPVVQLRPKLIARGEKVREPVVLKLVRVGRDLSQPSTVQFEQAAGTANSNDYRVEVDRVKFLADETTKTVSVQLVDDEIREANEQLQFEIVGKDNAAVAYHHTSTIEIVDAGPIRINAGGRETFVDHRGNRWLPDSWFVKGFVYPILSKLPFTMPIAETVDDYIYQSERGGVEFECSIPVGNGTYDLVFHFCELAHNEVGIRSFNVLVEGRELISELDLLEVGKSRYTAYVHPVRNVVIVDGSLDIDFIMNKDNASVSGIEVIPQR